MDNRQDNNVAVELTLLLALATYRKMAG